MNLDSLIIISNKVIIWHILDILLISENFTKRIKKRINQEFGIDANQIFLTATHTHSGPKVSTYLFPDIKPDAEYLTYLETKIIENTSYCLNNQILCNAFYSQIETANLYGNRNNPMFPYNNRLGTVLFKDHSGKNIVQLVNISCHPTNINPEFTGISSDIFGIFKNNYEKETEIPLIVINGEAGDVSTRHTRKSQEYDEVELLGTTLSKVLQQANRFVPLELNTLTISICEFSTTYFPKKDKFIIKLEKDLNYNIINEAIQKTQDANNDLLQRIRSKLSNDKIIYKYCAAIIETSDFRIIFFPGELVTCLGTLLRTADQKKPLSLLIQMAFMVML